MAIAQRRAVKALKRKAVVRAKREAEKATLRGSYDLRIRNSSRDVPMPKASEALIDIAVPLLEQTHDLVGYRKTLSIAMLAWNLSMLPVKERQDEADKFLDSLMAKIGIDDNLDALRAAVNEAITLFISRKTLFYPSDARQLVDVEVIDTGTEYRVNVKSEFELAD